MFISNMLKNLIILIFALFVLAIPIYAASDKQEVLDVTLHYKDKAVSIVSIDRREGFLPDYLNQPKNGYSLAVVDKDNGEVFKVKFNFPLQVIYEQDIRPNAVNVNKNVPEELKEAKTMVTVPLIENSTKIKVYDPNNKEVLDQELGLITTNQAINRSAIPQIPWPWKVFWLSLGAIVFFVAAYIFLHVTGRKTLAVISIVLGAAALGLLALTVNSKLPEIKQISSNSNRGIDAEKIKGMTRDFPTNLSSPQPTPPGKLPF